MNILWMMYIIQRNEKEISLAEIHHSKRKFNSKNKMRAFTDIARKEKGQITDKIHSRFGIECKWIECLNRNVEPGSN